MESVAIHSARHIFLMVGIILGACSISGVLARKLRVPDVVLFLLIGVGLAPGLTAAIDVKADSDPET